MPTIPELDDDDWDIWLQPGARREGGSETLERKAVGEQRRQSEGAWITINERVKLEVLDAAVHARATVNRKTSG